MERYEIAREATELWERVIPSVDHQCEDVLGSSLISQAYAVVRAFQDPCEDHIVPLIRMEIADG